MHRKIDSIFRQHEEWLESGGESSLQVVRTSNLMQLVSQGLEEAEAEAEQAGYWRGLKEGTDRGRRLEREAYEKKHEEGR